MNGTGETEVTSNESIMVDEELYQKYTKNRAVSDTAYWLILIGYAVLIVVGSIGNLFVILAVINNKGLFFQMTHDRRLYVDL